MNLSSVIVLVKPEHLHEVIESIKTSKDFEYHLHDETGKIIITIEGKNSGEEIKKLNKLQVMPHIISAEMVFSYSKDELDQDKDKLEKLKNNLPDWLNDSNAEMKDIKYGGDIRDKL